jgi:hypothetical protein
VPLEPPDANGRVVDFDHFTNVNEHAWTFSNSQMLRPAGDSLINHCVGSWQDDKQQVDRWTALVPAQWAPRTTRQRAQGTWHLLLATVRARIRLSFEWVHVGRWMVTDQIVWHACVGVAPRPHARTCQPTYNREKDLLLLLCVSIRNFFLREVILSSLYIRTCKLTR